MKKIIFIYECTLRQKSIFFHLALNAIEEKLQVCYAGRKLKLLGIVSEKPYTLAILTIFGFRPVSG